MKIRLFSTFLMLHLFPYAIFCQDAGLDFLRSTGKIYSVFAVILILFIGIIFYMISLDRKIKKLEKNNNNE